MSQVLIKTSTLTGIANAIRTRTGETTKYKPSEMPNIIRNLPRKPLYDFETCTDEELTEMVKAYYSGEITLDDVKSVWSVGDKRAISLSAMEATNVDETHVAQTQKFIILDFDHDTLSTAKGDITNALITIQSYRLLSNGTTLEGGYMTKNGGNTRGWGSSARRAWCNNEFYNALPTNIKSLVKQVTKEYYGTYTSTTLSTVNDYAFLPSCVEVTNKSGGAPAAKDGSQYKLYANYSTTYSIKYVGDINNTGDVRSWRTRSPGKSGIAKWVNINTSGTGGEGSGNSTIGIAPCICL